MNKDSFKPPLTRVEFSQKKRNFYMEIKIDRVWKDKNNITSIFKAKNEDEVKLFMVKKLNTSLLLSLNSEVIIFDFIFYKWLCVDSFLEASANEYIDMVKKEWGEFYGLLVEELEEIDKKFGLELSKVLQKKE